MSEYKEYGDFVDCPPDTSKMTEEQRLKADILFCQECTIWLKNRLKEVKKGDTGRREPTNDCEDTDRKGHGNS